MKRYLTLEKPDNGVDDAKGDHLNSEGANQDITKHTLNEKSEAALFAFQSSPDIQGQPKIQWQLENPKDPMPERFPDIQGQQKIQWQLKNTTAKDRKCILLVDHEPTGCRVGKVLLEQFGYEVVSQTSSLEALEIFRQTPHRFDLVVADYTMPNMAGQELAQHILKINASTPIIICTNVISELSDVQLKAMGIQAILVKPISLYKLECAIRQVLDRTPSLSS